jgi:hypothetical protein
MRILLPAAGRFPQLFGTKGGVAGAFAGGQRPAFAEFIAGPAQSPGRIARGEGLVPDKELMVFFIKISQTGFPGEIVAAGQQIAIPGNKTMQGKQPA